MKMTVDEINLSFKMDTPDWCETTPENIRNLLHVVRYLLKSILLLCEGDSPSKNIHQDTQEGRRILLDGFILNTGVVESKMVFLLSIIKKAIHSQMDSECYHYVSEAKSSTSTSSTHNSTNGNGTNNSHDVERHNVTSTDTGEPKQQDLSTNDLVGSVEKEKLTEFTVEKSKIGKIWLDYILSTFTIREKKKNTNKRNLSEQIMSNTNITNNNKNSQGEDLEETSSVLLSMILYEIMVHFVSSSESLNHQDNKNRNFSKLIVNVSSSCLSSSSSQQLSQVSAKPKEKRRNIIDDTENELFLLNANNRMNNNFHEELIREAIRNTKKKTKLRYDDDMTKNKTSSKTTKLLMSEQLSQYQQQQYEQAKYKAIQKNLIILIESIFLQATISSTLSNFKTNVNSFNRRGLDIVPITSTKSSDDNNKRDDDIMVQTASQQLQKQKFKYELYELERKTKAFVLNDIASIQILMKKIKEEISHFYPASKAQSQEQEQQQELSHQPFCRVNASLRSIYYSTPAKRKNNENTSNNLLFIQITIPGNDRHYPIHHRRHKKRNNNKYNASSSSQPSTYICVLFPGNNMLAICTNSSLSNIIHQSCSSMKNNISSENKTRINNKTIGKIPSIPVDSITIPFLFTSCSTPQQIEYTPFVLASLCSSMCDFKDSPYSNNGNMNSLNNHHNDRKKKDQESATSSTRRKNSSSQRSYQKKRKGSYYYRESVNLNVILRQQKQTQQYKQHQSDPISLLLSALHMQHKSSGVGKFAQLVNNLDSHDNNDHNNNDRRNNKTSDEDANNNSNNPLVDLNAASTNPSSSTNRNKRRNQQRLELSSQYGLKTGVLAANIQSNFHNDSYNHHCDSNNIDNEKSSKVNKSCKEKSSVFSLVASSSSTSSLNNERATKGNKSHVIVEKQSASSSSNTKNSMNTRAPSAPISLLSDKSNLLSNSKGSTTEVQTNNANNTRGFGDPTYLPRIEKLVYKWSGTTEIVDTSSTTKTSANDDDINNNQSSIKQNNSTTTKIDGDVNDLVEASFKCTVSFQGSHVYQGLQALLDCGIAKHPLPSYVVDAPMMESNVIRVNNDGFHAEQSNC